MPTERPSYDPSAFPPFAVTVDLVILTVAPPQLKLLLVKRSEEPFAGQWTLPGGFVGPNQSLLDAAETTLTNKTGITVSRAHLEQLETFGDPTRDPRMRIVSVSYLALVANPGEPASTAAEHAAWVDVDDIDRGALGFDHDQIIGVGLERARAKLEYSTLATTFCGREFTIGELREVYETVWGQSLDPANFHRKALATEDFLVPTGNQSSGGKGRPAKTYKRGKATELIPPISR